MNDILQHIVSELNGFLAELEAIRQKAHNYKSPEYYGNQHFTRWKERLVDFIRSNISLFEAEKCRTVKWSLKVLTRSNTRDAFDGFNSRIWNHASYLKALIDDITNNPSHWIKQISLTTKTQVQQRKRVSQFERIAKLCEKFPLVVRQLRKRSHNRDPLLMSDEYDVQYLLHALLRILFDDVRPEEWTPSYAGSASRMDFLLKDEKIVVETKMARENHKEKDIKDELIIDTANYKNHPDCETLICFIYDPDGRISNPQGFIKDLVKQSSNELKVKVLIQPQ